jgi:hypothetical protein
MGAEQLGTRCPDGNYIDGVAGGIVWAASTDGKLRVATEDDILSSGLSGFQGASGYSGISGARGFSGYSGVGSAGASGYSGMNGAAGTVGSGYVPVSNGTGYTESGITQMLANTAQTDTIMLSTTSYDGGNITLLAGQTNLSIVMNSANSGGSQNTMTLSAVGNSNSIQVQASGTESYVRLFSDTVSILLSDGIGITAANDTYLTLNGTSDNVTVLAGNVRIETSQLSFIGIPTAAGTLSSGMLWSDTGTIKIVA